MTTRNTHSKDDHKKDADHTKQNFASKSKEEVKELASKGGRSHGTPHKDEDTKSTSHAAKTHTTHTRKEDDKDSRSSSHAAKSHTTHANETKKDKDEDHREHGKQGFASMPHDKVVEIARLGGLHSHDNDNKKKDDTETRSSAKK